MQKNYAFIQRWLPVCAEGDGDVAQGVMLDTPAAYNRLHYLTRHGMVYKRSTDCMNNED